MSLVRNKDWFTMRSTSLIFIIATVLACFTTTTIGSGVWPRNSALKLFVPYDEKHETNDIAHGLAPSMCLWPQPRDDIKGPFGAYNTSYGIKTEPSYICCYEPQISVTRSFTYSFYYYYESTEGFSAIILNDSPPLFGVGYASNDGIEISLLHYQQPALKLPNIFKPKQWNFLAIVYDDPNQILAFYNENGDLIHEETDFHVPEPFTTEYLRFFTGLHNINGTYTNMRQEDAIACVMVYNETLTAEEIAQLPSVCENKGTGTLPTIDPSRTTTTAKTSTSTSTMSSTSASGSSSSTSFSTTITTTT